MYVNFINPFYITSDVQILAQQVILFIIIDQKHHLRSCRWHEWWQHKSIEYFDRYININVGGSYLFIRIDIKL